MNNRQEIINRYIAKFRKIDFILGIYEFGRHSQFQLGSDIDLILILKKNHLTKKEISVLTKLVSCKNRQFKKYVRHPPYILPKDLFNSFINLAYLPIHQFKKLFGPPINLTINKKNYRKQRLFSELEYYFIRHAYIKKLLVDKKLNLGEKLHYLRGFYNTINPLKIHFQKTKEVIDNIECFNLKYQKLMNSLAKTLHPRHYSKTINNLLFKDMLKLKLKFDILIKNHLFFEKKIKKNPLLKHKWGLTIFANNDCLRQALESAEIFKDKKITFYPTFFADYFFFLKRAVCDERKIDFCKKSVFYKDHLINEDLISRAKILRKYYLFLKKNSLLYKSLLPLAIVFFNLLED